MKKLRGRSAVACASHTAGTRGLPKRSVFVCRHISSQNTILLEGFFLRKMYCTATSICFSKSLGELCLTLQIVMTQG